MCYFYAIISLFVVVLELSMLKPTHALLGTIEPVDVKLAGIGSPDDPTHITSGSNTGFISSSNPAFSFEQKAEKLPSA